MCRCRRGHGKVAQVVEKTRSNPITFAEHLRQCQSMTPNLANTFYKRVTTGAPRWTSGAPSSGHGHFDFEDIEPKKSLQLLPPPTEKSRKKQKVRTRTKFNFFKEEFAIGFQKERTHHSRTSRRVRVFSLQRGNDNCGAPLRLPA